MNWKKTLKKNKLRLIGVGSMFVASIILEIKFFIIIEYLLKANTILCAVQNGVLAVTCMMFLCLMLWSVAFYGDKIEEVE